MEGNEGERNGREMVKRIGQGRERAGMRGGCAEERQKGMREWMG